MWKVGTKTMMWRNYSGYQPSIFLSDGKTLVTNCKNGSKKEFWDAETGNLKSERLGHSRSISSYGSMVAFGSTGYPIYLWYLSPLRSRPPLLLGDDENYVSSLDFSSTGRFLVSGISRTMRSYGSDMIHSIILWEIKTQKPVHKIKGFGKAVTSIKFSPSDKILLTKSNGQIQLWSLQTYRVLREIKDSAPTRLSALYEKAEFSPDGTLIASNSDDIIKLRDAQTLQLTRTLKSPHGRVTSFAFAPDGVTLMSGHDDGTVLIWRVR